MFAAARPRVQAVSVACMKTNVLCNVDSGHVRSARLLKSRRSVALAARDVQNSLPSYKARCESVTVDMLPKRILAGALGDHALARGFQRRRIRAVHPENVVARAGHIRRL